MGRASTQVFVREGARVLAADISGGQDDTAAALGDAVSAFQVDVTQEDSVEAMFAAAVERFGRVELAAARMAALRKIVAARDDLRRY